MQDRWVADPMLSGVGEGDQALAGDVTPLMYPEPPHDFGCCGGWI